LLFPDGHLPSPRWRWLGYACGLVVVAICVSSALAPNLDVGPSDDTPGVSNPLAVARLETVLDAVLAVSFPVLAAAVALTALSVLLRFQASRGDTRQQLKWFLATVLLMAGSIPVDVISPAAASAGSAVAIVAIPLAIGVAILRYRLYDIDRIINRTLVYGSLTVALGAAYAGLVVGLQALFRPFTGGSELAITITTLAVAAAFQPARRRIQDAVDRRFNRRRYDAGRTLEAFSGRLRDEVDLEALRHELVAVVSETMEPAHVSLWLKGAEAQR
jgi:hypothetical protein